MSYNRPHPDSQHSSGGGGRDWEHYRDRPPSRNIHGNNESGVVRDRRRAMSNDRDARNLPPMGSSDARSHSRSRHSRWPYDARHRGGTVSGASAEAERGRDWDRGGRRGREHLGISRHSSSRDAAYNESSVPPPLTSRHTTSSFSRGRATTASNMPQFSRRATQPGESLEEGELDLDDRSSSSHARSMGSRTYTTPADSGAHARRSDTHSSMFRGDRRSPMPSTSAQPPSSHYGAQGRGADRKYSYSSHRSESRHQSRATTPSPKHQPAKPVEVVRTPSPVSLPARMPLINSTFGRPPKPEPNTHFEVGSSSRPIHQPRPEAGNGLRTPSPRDITPEPEVPKLHLQSRISDIDREIAECKEKLVQISGSRIYTEADDSSAVAQQPTLPSKEKQKESASDDRAVPTSPPAKLAAVSTERLPIQDSKDSVATELPVAKAEASVSDMAAPVVPQTAVEFQPEPTEMDMDSVFGSSASESEDVGEKRANKDKLSKLVNSIYAENQKRAAEVQARLAKPFLSAFPTLIPGLYQSPTEWPFWAENEKTHEKVKPHLVKILGREKLQQQSHARRLQEEYSTLYAKWRKRVDKLDRQREAKQRGASSGAAASSSGQTALGASSHRRRTAGAANVMTTDEFGFSLGPLFSASANPSHHLDAGGRLDDSLFTSDAVHSEAELQAIIERLQHDDARNPDLRSQRTAATIPDMVTDPIERQMLRFDNNSHLVTDPLTFYHVRLPEPGSSADQRVAYSNNADANHYWTQSEVSAFVTAYLTYPKEFGKVAAHIPHKTMNDCVLFYYRNKKQLKLKELEAKSLKRARRSRQAGTSGGGSGRRRKERARERRERKAREDRERMAMEAAAECAPVDHRPEGIATPVDEGLTTHARSSAMPSEDEGAASATGSLQLSAEASDILERRSKSSALLRSIIAANRQRKREAVMEGASLLSLDDNVAGIDEIPPIVSPAAASTPLPADEDDDEMEEDMESIVSPSASLHSFNTKLVSPEKRRQRADEPSGSAASSLPPSVPVSTVSTRTRHDLVEEGAADSNGADKGNDFEGGEKRTLRRNAGSDNGDEDEEEGELVEDTHWEPRRRSRQPSELNAYAMGGSIVRTRRTREIEQASAGYQSDSNSDDNYSVYRSRRARRRSSLTSAPGEDEEDIVEISGVVAAASSDRSSRPRIVSRRSQSRFGAMFTAVLDSEDNADAGSTATGNDGDGNGPLVMLRQRSATPLSPSIPGDWQAAKGHAGSPPKESAQDRYVAEEPEGLKRPISSYETLMMCLSATGSLQSPVSGASNSQQQASETTSGKTQSTSTTQLRRQLESQVEEETGVQESVLVGAAVWLREDRRRVLRGFHKLGPDFAQVASLMPSKTTAQCRYFYYHYRTPAGALISETIGSGPATTAPTQNTGDGRQPSVDSLVLPPTNRSQSSAAGLALPVVGAKPKPTARTVSGRAVPASLQASLAKIPVNPIVKRQRTKSPSGSSDDDDDDEVPLAAQLAEELAAQAALERSQPPTPVMPVGSVQPMQRLASDIAQVRPEALNSRATPIAALVLPPKPASGVTPTSVDMPLSAGSVVTLSGPLSSGSSMSVANNASGRTSPHSPVPGAAGTTAKKSGYSSYWSVHERSAFMHYVVRLGQNWQRLAEAIGSKTGTQVRNYFRANREKLGLDAVVVEYERNKAAGTLPEMVPFQVASGSTGPAGAGAAKDDVVKKEKRGRKRKTEVAAKSPRVDVSGDKPLAQAVVLPDMATPSTAPANITNFPTMGVDGGRAVVYARPPPAAKDAGAPMYVRPQLPLPSASQTLPRPPQPWTRPPVHNMPLPAHTLPPPAHTLPPPPPYAGQQHRYSLPPVAGMEAPEPRIGSVARDESNTPMSQPTPPPVDGLPRFSSSPAPIVAAQQGRASLSALHISNLTTGNTRFTARPPEPVAEEPRKASVSKINELLNDEPAAIEPAAADWFNEAPSQEDEATGIAALALASMMGRRTPEPRAEQRNTLSVAYPQPRAYMPHRPSDPLPPIAAASQPIHTAPSAFSPVAMSRPQSVDPAYAHSPHVRVMSPAPVQPLQQHQRQRKPSAPPLPPPSGPFVSHPPGYVGYPGSQSLRPVYPHGSSPQVPAQTVYQESEYPPRFGDPPRAYTSGQQMPRPAYYYPISPSQQQQQIQQQQQQQQHPSSNAGPPAYSGYRPQRPYQPPPPM